MPPPNAIISDLSISADKHSKINSNWRMETIVRAIFFLSYTHENVKHILAEREIYGFTFRNWMGNKFHFHCAMAKLKPMEKSICGLD